jgi:hypothetical protein
MTIALYIIAGVLLLKLLIAVFGFLYRFYKAYYILSLKGKK